MNDDNKKKLKEAVRAWAKASPLPDEPVFGVPPEGMLSPKQLAEAVEKETPTGQYVIGIIDHALSNGTTIDEVVKTITRKPQP